MGSSAGPLGILVTGGYSKSSVELYPDSSLPSSCSIPELPAKRDSHSANVLCGQLVLCGGDSTSTQNSCIRLGAGGWQNLLATRQKRKYHTGHTINDRILLIGGSQSDTGSEY